MATVRKPKVSENAKRTLSAPGGRLSGYLVYLGEPSKVVLGRVAGKVKQVVSDFDGKIDLAGFIANSGAKICECDCFCSCSCDCQCNCDCVCYCDCNCPCLCSSACDSAIALAEIREISAEMVALEKQLQARFGQGPQIAKGLRRG